MRPSDEHDTTLLARIDERVGSILEALQRGEQRMNRIDTHLETVDTRVVKLENYKIWLMGFAGGIGALVSGVFSMLYYTKK